MRRKTVMSVCVVFFLLLSASPGFSAVEWNVVRTLQLEKAPLDMAVSARGTWTYILTDGGFVMIYSAQGELKERLFVGKNIDGIDAGTRDDILIVKSKKDKMVQQIRIDFIHEINVTGSPFQGPESAPVTIAVFNDFQ